MMIKRYVVGLRHMFLLGTLLALPGPANADLLIATGYVEAVLGCEYASNNTMFLVKLDDGNWYRSEGNSSSSDARALLQGWAASAATTAILTNRTVTLLYHAQTQTFCGTTVVGRFDYSNNYGGLQLNAD